MKIINSIQKVKQFGFSTLSILALLMALYMIFDVTYPLTADTVRPSAINGQIIAKQKVSYEDIFSGRARRVGDRLLLVATV